MIFASSNPFRAPTRRFFQWGMLSVLLGCAGCVGTYDTLSPPFGANPNPEDTALDGQYAHSELDEAARMIHGGHYAQAILRLERIVDKYSGTDAGIEARYLLASAYEEIGGLEKARGYYAEYVELAPPGEHVRLSQKSLAILRGDLTAHAEAEDPRVVALREEMDAAPGEMTYPLELAEYLWHVARYQEAGELYVWLLEHWPGLMADVTLRQRIARETDGSYTVLTPAEVLRRSRAAQPLQIVNVQSFRSGLGGDSSLGFSNLRNRYFHVTGEAVNQGEAPLQFVTIRTTLYGFARRVYDVRTVNIGRLEPGETSAFSVRFENFDNIENIQDYECVGTYVR